MIRAAFLRRMAFAALASAFLEMRLPEMETSPLDYLEPGMVIGVYDLQRIRDGEHPLAVLATLRIKS